MPIIRFAAATALLILASTGASQAACQCACVEGRVEAICQSSIDIKPICAPQICQLTPPSVRPIQTPTIPPIGARSCAPHQVFNPATNRYEWQTLCQ